MYLVVRDEDVPTVAEAIRAFAIEAGLEPLEGEEGAIVVALSGDGVVVSGLDLLDIADADEWAAHLSTACSGEVVALDVADDGVRVHVYDDGEEESVIEVPVDPSGQTTSDELPELEEGVATTSADELTSALLDRFGFNATTDVVTLAFADPIDRQLQVQPTLGVTLSGSVGGPVVSPAGHAFGVTLVGGDPLVGCRLELRGPALAQLAIASIDVDYRTQSGERQAHRLLPVPTEDGFELVLDDAWFERVDVAPSLDLTDVFSTMQRLVSATEDQQRNTLFVGIVATGRAAGEGDLILVASSLDGSIGPGEGAVSVTTRA